MFSQELTNAWKSVKAASPSEYVKLPAGRYTCRITAVRLDDANAEKSLPPCLRYTLLVLDGEHANERTEKTDFINNAKSLSFIKLDMKTLKVREPASIEDICFALQMAVGLSVEVEVKYTTGSSGKEFMNIYIKRIVERMATEDAQLAVFDEHQPEEMPVF